MENKTIDGFVKAVTIDSGKADTQMLGTAVVNSTGKFVVIDGSDVEVPILEGTEVMNGDRVVVTITNHRATVIGNVTSPASARTATNFMDLTTEGLEIGDLVHGARGKNYSRVTANGLDVFVAGTRLAHFGTNATLGTRKDGTVGQYSFTAGQNNVASQAWCVAVGNDNVQDGQCGIVAGQHNVASGAYSATFGSNLTNSGAGQLCIGQHNVDESDKVMVIGWGSAETPHNVFTVDRRGNVVCGKVNGVDISTLVRNSDIYYAHGEYVDTSSDAVVACGFVTASGKNLNLSIPCRKRLDNVSRCIVTSFAGGVRTTVGYLDGMGDAESWLKTSGGVAVYNIIASPNHGANTIDITINRWNGAAFGNVTNNTVVAMNCKAKIQLLS